MPFQKKSFSQCGQDKWVAKLFNGKSKGYFIELGAGDGINLSNTLMLEKSYAWTGILIEPTCMFEKLKINRPNCILENSCVASEKKIVHLVEIYDRGQTGDNLLLSQVFENYNLIDKSVIKSEWGVFKRSYEVEAIPLVDILKKYNTPKIINYFSLDVEGYEFEVLRNFPFNLYTFQCIGVERPSLELQNLLLKNDYKKISKVGEDKMFVHNSFKSKIPLRLLYLKYSSKGINFLNKLKNIKAD